MAPPSSGGIAVIQILEMLERFPSKTLATDKLPGAHLFTQASRLAFADRGEYLGDPAFVNVPVNGLLNRTYLAQRSRLIDPAKDMGKADAGNPPGAQADHAVQRSPEHPGTSHMSIVDDKGIVVSMTTTVEAPFGLGDDGWRLHPRQSAHRFLASIPCWMESRSQMQPGPGKHPLSSMAPTIVLGREGKFKFAIGSPGGPLIIDYVAQSIIGLIDSGLKPQAATAIPHIANLNSPTLIESNTPLEFVRRRN